jgi:hypothetical protein
MEIVVKGGGRAPPTLTSQANFTLMMECTPESGRYHSVYSVGCTKTFSFASTVLGRMTIIEYRYVQNK